VQRVKLGILTVWLFACGGSTMAPPTGDDDVTPDAAPIDPPLGEWTTMPAGCTDAADAIYASPAQLPAARGAIVHCSLGDLLDQATVQQELADSGAEGVTAQTGVRVVKLAYRTERSNGAPALSSAIVYLPETPRSLPAPIVLIGRSTSGLADSCAPTKEDLPQANLALPFAARGFAVISPDYAGLGTDGTHSYLDNHDEVGQLFDGALALAALEPAGVVGDAVGAVGYSQGGGIVLSAQALEFSITGKRTLEAIAALAPEWPISTRSFGYEDVLRNPGQFTGLAGLAPPTVTVLRHYGFLINRMGMAGGEAFPADERDSIIGSINSLCTVPLGGALGAQQPKLADLVDDAFRLQVLACIDGTAGCTGLGQAFHQWLLADVVTADRDGAPVLIVQGLADQVMPAAGEAACDADKLRVEGVFPTICSDQTATHDSILEKKIEHVVAWVEATATGATAPTCSSQTLPTCNR
jgi:alpha-beta hydrolase superfamily lysophospholipase